ncbi:glycosyltransferase family 2 protein [bacterium]|nr:MAG: glycosyltransferase family 2 protein [bacterium]
MNPVSNGPRAPRVTILLTCYNHLAYLPEALEGVRAQTYRDFEVIALDDGSSDGSREWLAEQKDIRTIFNPQNLGTYGTLNVGLGHARGEFVAVLNDDDVWRPEKLARQVDLLDRHPKVALVHTGGWFLNGESKRQVGNPLGFAWPTFETDANGEWTGDALPALVHENKIIASAALARTSALHELDGFNEAYFGSGDWDMWWRVAEVHDVGFVADELTGYRVHGANASHKLDRIWRDDVRLREMIAVRMSDLSGRFPGWKREAAFNQAALGTVRMLTGDSFGSRTAYRTAMRLDPLRWKTYARWTATWAGRAAFRKLL